MNVSDITEDTAAEAPAEAVEYTEPGAGNPDYWAQQEVEARQKLTDAIDAIGALNAAMAPMNETKKPLVEQVKQTILLREQGGDLKAGEQVHGDGYYAYIQHKGSAGGVDLKALYHSDATAGPNMLRQLLELGLLRLDVKAFEIYHKTIPSGWSDRVNAAIVPGAGSDALMVEPKKA